MRFRFVFELTFLLKFVNIILNNFGKYHFKNLANSTILAENRCF